MKLDTLFLFDFLFSYSHDFQSLPILSTSYRSKSAYPLSNARANVRITVLPD